MLRVHLQTCWQGPLNTAVSFGHEVHCSRTLGEENPYRLSPFSINCLLDLFLLAFNCVAHVPDIVEHDMILYSISMTYCHYSISPTTKASSPSPRVRHAAAVKVNGSASLAHGTPDAVVHPVQRMPRQKVNYQDRSITSGY
jgi:hypothetical protein